MALQWTSLTDLLVSRNDHYSYGILKESYGINEWWVIEKSTGERVAGGKCNTVTKAKAEVEAVHKELKAKFKDDNVLYRKKNGKLVKR